MLFVDNPSSKSAIEPTITKNYKKKQNKIVALQASCLQLHKHTPQIFWNH
jgi:hypothetical protein